LNSDHGNNKKTLNSVFYTGFSTSLFQSGYLQKSISVVGFMAREFSLADEGYLYHSNYAWKFEIVIECRYCTICLAAFTVSKKLYDGRPCEVILGKTVSLK
jgi:hypothetical protein